MTSQHPITPPPELAKEWYLQAPDDDEMGLAQHIATQAARWGADQELAACCVLMDEWGLDGEDLIECRRSKPPSLKEKLKEAIYNENLGDALRLVEQLDDSL